MGWELIGSVPGIGFGSAGGKTAENVEQALELGFTHIDTAQAYGNEQEVGQALKESGLARENIWVTTKWSGRPWGNGGAISPRDSIHESLQKLGLQNVDLYLVHTPRLFAETGIREGWKQIEALQKEGLTKSIGVSNFTLKDMRELLEGRGGSGDHGHHKKHHKHHHHHHHQASPFEYMDEEKVDLLSKEGPPEIMPAANQIELHPYVWKEYQPNVDYCQKHNIAVEGYSPLKPLTTYPGGPLDKPLNRISKRLNVKPEQILLAWIKSKKVVALTTSTREERLRDYLSAGDIELTQQDIEDIEKAGAKGPQTKRRMAYSVLKTLAIQATAFCAYKYWVGT